MKIQHVYSTNTKGLATNKLGKKWLDYLKTVCRVIAVS